MKFEKKFWLVISFWYLILIYFTWDESLSKITSPPPKVDYVDTILFKFHLWNYTDNFELLPHKKTKIILFWIRVNFFIWLKSMGAWLRLLAITSFGITKVPIHTKLQFAKNDLLIRSPQCLHYFLII